MSCTTSRPWALTPSWHPGGILHGEDICGNSLGCQLGYVRLGGLFDVWENLPEGGNCSRENVRGFFRSNCLRECRVGNLFGGIYWGGIIVGPPNVIIHCEQFLRFCPRDADYTVL